jgi:hypothetical protein
MDQPVKVIDINGISVLFYVPGFLMNCLFLIKFGFSFIYSVFLT